MRTVCAYTLSFARPSAAEEVWREMTASISNWYRSFEPAAELPAGWERGLTTRVAPVAAHTLECAVASLEGAPTPLRELRWVYPDARDATLLWTIDAATLGGDGAIFTLLLRIASADFELMPARFNLMTPRVVRQIVARGDAQIGVHPISLDARRVDTDGVSELTMFLLEQSRRHPVIVISPEPYTDDVYSVDPELIANTVAGLASVYVLGSRWAAFALTDEVGKRLSCYNGAVRVYWPRFDFDADPFAHPLWLMEQVQGFGGPEEFARMLMRMIAGVASFRHVEPEAIRTYRSRLEEARITRIRNENKPAGYDELFEEYVKLDSQTRALREQLEGLTEENAALKGQLASRWVSSSGEGSAQRGAQDQDSVPKDVLEAVNEAQRRTSHLIFLPEAFESARDSPYKQPEKVHSALLAIDDVAGLWAKQLAGGAKLGARRDLFRARGFEYKEDISQTAEGKWGGEYTYVYEGRRLVFAPHITIGAKSADRCISIHLQWDEKRGKAVIAHVGRHKTNTRS